MAKESDVRPNPDTIAGLTSEDSPLQTIRDRLATFGSATRRVADWILEDSHRAGVSPITVVAEATGSSPASVTRFAVRLGFTGFPALRAAIAKENGRDLQAGWESDFGTVLAIDDPPGKILSVLASAEANAIHNTMASVDLAAAAHAADLIGSARRIHIYGEWGDGIAARELYVRLLRIGVPVWEHEGIDSALAVAQTLEANDVALVVSRAGSSVSAQEFLEAAHSHDASTISITGAAESGVAKATDITLFTGTRPGQNWNEYVAGRVGDSLVANFLVVLVAQRVPNETRHIYEFRPDMAMSTGRRRPKRNRREPR